MPLRHGHAISIDMAYSATLANLRDLLSDEDHRRLLNLFSRAGLSMDHHQFDEDILDKGTKAILRTRDGKLRAAVPSPLGQCVFLNDVSTEEMFKALRVHKELMKSYPRNGEGLEAFVDASDTGYTLNDKPVEDEMNGVSNGLKKLNVLNDDSQADEETMNGHANGVSGHTNGVNGHANGLNDHTTVDGKTTNGVSNATKHAAGDEVLKEKKNQMPLSNGVNGHVPHSVNGAH